MKHFNQTTLFYFVLGLLLVSGQVAAQVVINEYSAANWQQFLDNHHDHEDWIELYNTGDTPTNIGGYWLSDSENNLQKWQFPPTVIVPAHGFLVVWCSGRDTVDAGPFYHTNFKLTQTKSNPEVLSLSQPNGNLVDQVQEGLTAVHQSWCRATDGSNDWRICKTPTLGATNNNAVKYNAFAAQPVASEAAGFYQNDVTVSLSTTEPNSVIRYTTDGREPKANSPLYAGPITITQTTVLKARTFSTDPLILPSFIEFNTYLINEDFSLAVVSIAADTLLELANGNKQLRPIGSVEYFGKDKERKTISYGELNSHGQDSWVNPQRSLDWVSRDEMGYSEALQEKIFAYSDRDEYQRVIFRATGDDNYPGSPSPAHEGACHLRDDYVQSLAKIGGMELDVRASERCIAFLNGQYWGVYSIRENPDDHDYTEFYHNQDKYHLQYLLTWGSSWAEYGGVKAYEDWKDVRDFILNEDMADSANYAIVKSQLNVKSLIDYMMVNLNVVASDWLNYNTGWWRGLDPAGNHKKWGYILWDDDATFDYYINYSGVPNTTPTALPCDLDQIGVYMDQFFGLNESVSVDPVTGAVTMYGNIGKHEKVFKKLQNSPEFRQLYYSRSADMMNTVFSCENMLSVFDSMVAVIQPEMPRHIARWGGTLTEWKTNINTMRDFITQRCAFFDNGLMNCFNLTGPYNVTLLVDPPGSGKIDINTLKIKDFPWTGQYFGNMDQLLEAKELPNGQPFYKWVSKAGNTIGPDAFNPDVKVTLTQPDTLVALFGVSSTWELGNGYTLEVFPTIAKTNLFVQYSLPESREVSLNLYNELGQIIAQYPQPENGGGEHTTTLQLPAHLASGVYWLAFDAGAARKTVKIFVP